MSNQLLKSFLIEVFLILITTLFLLQPKVIFRLKYVWFVKIFYGLGMTLLLITFIWSIVFGFILFLYGFRLDSIF